MGVDGWGSMVGGRWSEAEGCIRERMWRSALGSAIPPFAKTSITGYQVGPSSGGTMKEDEGANFCECLNVSLAAGVSVRGAFKTFSVRIITF